MTVEERLFRAMMEYKQKFGDDALPGLDYIPVENRGEEAYLALLEKCIAENKPMEQVIELIRYPPDVLI